MVLPSHILWLLNLPLTTPSGPIIRLSLAGDDVVVLNDAKDAEELVSRYAIMHRLAY